MTAQRRAGGRHIIDGGAKTIYLLDLKLGANENWDQGVSLGIKLPRRASEAAAEWQVPGSPLGSAK